MNKFSLKVFFQNLSQLKEITPYQKDVLVSLVSYFGTKGCFPSHTTLAVDAGVSPRTVAKVLKEARLRGWLDDRYNIVSIIKLIMIILILRSGLNCLLVSYRKFKILTFIKIFS